MPIRHHVTSQQMWRVGNEYACCMPQCRLKLCSRRQPTQHLVSLTESPQKKTKQKKHWQFFIFFHLVLQIDVTLQEHRAGKRAKRGKICQIVSYEFMALWILPLSREHYTKFITPVSVTSPSVHLHCVLRPLTHSLSFCDWKEKELHRRVTVNEHLFSAAGALPTTYVSQIVTAMWSIFLPFDVV